MGVYGNISLAALLFASKLLFKPNRWNNKVVKLSFWSINVGLMLMVVLDLFPAGAIQFKTVLDKGFWYARSEDFITGTAFESLTWLRGIGASVFFFGGVLPLTWFIVRRFNAMKKFNPSIFLFGDSNDNNVEGKDLDNTAHLMKEKEILQGKDK